MIIYKKCRQKGVVFQSVFLLLLLWPRCKEVHDLDSSHRLLLLFRVSLIISRLLLDDVRRCCNNIFSS